MQVEQIVVNESGREVKVVTEGVPTDNGFETRLIPCLPVKKEIKKYH